MPFGRFPSFETVITSASNVAKRFPLPLLFAIVGSIVCVVLINREHSDNTSLLQRIAFSCALALPLLIALGLTAEKVLRTSTQRLTLHLFGLLLIVAYFLSLPQHPLAQFEPIARFAILAVAAHMLVAVLPFAAKPELNGFWQFNKSMFLRFLMAALYSAVLFIGLSIALLSADRLFGMHISDSTYFKLWILVVGIFNTWVFLAGVPKQLDQPEQQAEMPGGLKLFTQYILLPLVTLYLLILYAYGIKILLQWDLPKGWVSHLVLWFSVAGILSLLLLWPLGQRTDNKWVRTFSQWFFQSLIPLLVMLVLAISVRTGEYGLTVNRYLVWAMAVGLIVVVLYFVFSRKKDIRLIPAVIISVALWSAIGPINAFSAAESSQRERFLQIVHRPPALATDAKTDSTYTETEIHELNSISSYLCEWHGAAAWKSVIPDSIMRGWDTLPTYALNDSVAATLAYPRWFGMPSSPNDSSLISFNANYHIQFGMAVEPTICLVKFSWPSGIPGQNDSTLLSCGDINCWLMPIYSTPVRSFAFLIDDAVGSDTIRVSINEMIKQARQSNHRNWQSQSPLQFQTVGNRYHASLIIIELQAFHSTDSTVVNGLSGYLLLGPKSDSAAHRR